MLKIDSHTHIIPKKLPNWTEKFGYGDFIYLQHHKKGTAKMMRGNQFFREIKENAWNPDLRIQEYAKFNTQVQVAMAASRAARTATPGAFPAVRERDREPGSGSR